MAIVVTVCKEGVEEERESVWMVVVGEEVMEERAAWAPDGSDAFAKETRLTPCTRAQGLWHATVDKEACRHQWHL